ncbi:hypothetical protein Tco_0584223 [Tanacetum coccineum]
MENVNSPPTNNRPILPTALHAKFVQELHELQAISAFVDSRLESIEQSLNSFPNQPNETNMNDLESDDESVDTPLFFPFWIPITIQMMVKFLMSYTSIVMSGGEVLLPTLTFLPMETISRESLLHYMVEKIKGYRESTSLPLFRDVYVFVGSFTYVTDFVVLEDIGWNLYKWMYTPPNRGLDGNTWFLGA